MAGGDSMRELDGDEYADVKAEFNAKVETVPGGAALKTTRVQLS